MTDTPTESPKDDLLKLLAIAEDHIGMARVAVSYGHFGRLYEEITRAIGTLRQVSHRSGASKLADAVTMEGLRHVRCSACERPLYTDPGPEEHGPQKNASMHLIVATRRREVVSRGVLSGEIRVRDYPNVCSFACFDKIIATWPPHPDRDEILATNPKSRRYIDELYGVRYVSELLLDEVARAHLERELERSGG